MAQIVNDGRDGCIGQADGIQQRRGVGREQAAVVRREADGRVAFVNEREESHQVVVVAGGFRREGVVSGHSVCNVVAYRFAQAIVVVAGIIDGQEAAVLGVEHEEQAVENNQGGLPDDRKARLWRVVSQCLHQLRKDALEHDA